MLDAQMKRGLIENCVLAALARGDSYGYQIVKDLSSVVAVTESTLYPILRRLEGGGRPPAQVLPPHAGRPATAGELCRRLGRARGDV